MQFIAEIGLNHNGNTDLIYELIRQAKFSGATIAKLQLGWRGKEGELNYLTQTDLEKITKTCHYFEIDLMFSVFTLEAYDLLKPFSPGQRFK